MAVGDYVVGSDGWVTNNLDGGMPSLARSWEPTPATAIMYDAAWNNGTYAFSGAARNVSGDVVGGKYNLVVTMQGQDFSSGSAFALTIGDAGITDSSPQNHLTLVYDTRDNTLYYYVHRNGEYQYTGKLESPADLEADGVHQLKVSVDLNAGTASVYYRDVEVVDETFNPVGNWVLNGSWNCTLPMSSITQMGIASSNYKYFYKVESIPEPATMGLLSLGGLLLARRRK